MSQLRPSVKLFVKFGIVPRAPNQMPLTWNSLSFHFACLIEVIGLIPQGRIQNHRRLSRLRECYNVGISGGSIRIHTIYFLETGLNLSL
ncbi:unnamed protein product [Nezara viridula]|uniref:Uncharacterized protein n=1 Tax=Nezara viridula TaxID=85310 RepID=A0A9P0MPR5_NEZVI|nr:unnamed protein product [Nezara viridula]